MSQNDKYYTPDITDYYTGYEFQAIAANVPIEEVMWDWQTFSFASIASVERAWHEYNTTGVSRIRVPYLTKEQIEKEGWESYSSSEFSRDGYKMVIRVDKTISIWETWNGEILYNGKCPSINEFNKICKLIGCE